MLTLVTGHSKKANSQKNDKKIKIIMSSILEQQFRSKWGVWAALGAGCLAGMSGLLLIQRLSLRIDHTPSQSLTHELSALHSTIQELRQEIKQIKKPTLK